MSDPKVLDPVDETPKITRDIKRRRSKYDPVLDKAMKTAPKAVPVEFDSHASATAGRRRIKDRVPLHEHGSFSVEQRGEKVYVTAE